MLKEGGTEGDCKQPQKLSLLEKPREECKERNSTPHEDLKTASCGQLVFGKTRGKDFIEFKIRNLGAWRKCIAVWVCTPESIRPMQILEYAKNYFAATEQHFCYSFWDEIVLLSSYFEEFPALPGHCAIAPSLHRSPQRTAQQLAQSQGVRGDSEVPHGDLRVQ